jgi:hypothetical protein
MAIETAFETLQRQLEKLKEELGELRVNAEDFYPPGRPHERKNGHKAEEAPPPVVALADKAADLEGEIEGALRASRKAARAVRHPRNLVEAQREMGSIQQCLNRALRQQFTEVAAYDPVHRLMQIGRELGDGWPKWAELIKSIINGCRDRLVDAFQALAECWQELADKLAANSVLVQSTNIGQQITAPEGVASTVQGFT